MKKTLFVLALGLGFIGSNHVYGQPNRTQTAEQQLQEFIPIVKSRISSEFPFLKYAEDSMSCDLEDLSFVHRIDVYFAERLWIDTIANEEVEYILEHFNRQIFELAELANADFKRDTYQIYILDPIVSYYNRQGWEIKHSEYLSLQDRGAFSRTEYRLGFKLESRKANEEILIQIKQSYQEMQQTVSSFKTN